MAKQKDFNSFLSNIEPSPSTVNYISSIQTTLRDYLKSHGTYKDAYYDSFLSGSYAKHTSIRPVSGENKRDVDIIIVTNYAKSKNSTDVIEELCDVLKEKSDYKNVKKNSHSVSIEMGQVGVDVVPVIKHAINENLYYIGNYDDGLWALTDPKGHIEWSTTVNGDNSNEYKPLVKIMKWWRRENCPESHKYPKGITLEKIK
ncbi:hypothetical protein LJB83_02150 [Clostridia bacterium OttesenSCG-928-F22]|nr:hypothetical protein [Clostridia bacterium OttesenSCG-928-F22]